MNGKELNEIEEDMKRHNAEYAERVASPFPDTTPLIWGLLYSGWVASQS